MKPINLCQEQNQTPPKQSAKQPKANRIAEKNLSKAERLEPTAVSRWMQRFDTSSGVRSGNTLSRHPAGIDFVLSSAVLAFRPRVSRVRLLFGFVVCRCDGGAEWHDDGEGDIIVC